MDGRLYIQSIKMRRGFTGEYTVAEIEIEYEDGQFIKTNLSIDKAFIGRLEIYEEVKKYFKGNLIVGF